jgi:hypothetical protein
MGCSGSDRMVVRFRSIYHVVSLNHAPGGVVLYTMMHHKSLSAICDRSMVFYEDSCSLTDKNGPSYKTEIFLRVALSTHNSLIIRSLKTSNLPVVSFSPLF